MLLKIQELVKKYKIRPKGVIHIGAHLGEELDDYLEVGVKNIAWIEANPKIFPRLCQNVKKHTGSRCFNQVITEKDNENCLFNVTNNGESSSILNLKEHAIEHPHIKVIEKFSLKTITFDSLCTQENIDLQIYNFANIDVQGAELMVLKGMRKALDYIDAIYLEVNIKEMYEGCALLCEINRFLNIHGFRIRQKKILSHGWGDAFYKKTFFSKIVKLLYKQKTTTTLNCANFLSHPKTSR